MYVVNLHAENSLQLQVPAPISEWSTSYSAAVLFRAFNASSLAIAGSRRKANDNGSADVLGGYKTLFYIFQQVFGKKEVLQIRGGTDKVLAKITGQRISDSDTTKDSAQSILMINSTLPKGSNLTELQTSIGDFQVLWQRSPFTNQLRKSSSGGFAELFLTRQDRRELSFKPFLSAEALATESGVKSIVGYLQDWLFAKKGTIASKGSDLYRKPLIEELLFCDQEFLTPLTRFIEHHRTAEQWTEEDRNQLQVLKNTATVFDYDLRHYRHRTTGQEYLILAEKEDLPEKRHWGTFIFRLGNANGYLIQVPRPLSERNVFEYAASLFDNLEARALLISGAHPMANIDGSADVIKQQNKGNLFNLVNQVLLRQSGTLPMLVVQCRAFAYKADIEPPDANALISLYSGLNLSSGLSPLTSQVIRTLKEQYKFSVKVVSGEINEAGYEVGGIPQALYLEQSENKEFINLWLSPLTRGAFRQQTENRVLENHFISLQLETSERELYSFLLEDKTLVLFSPPDIDMDKLKKSITTYTDSYDILALQQIVTRWPELRFHQIIDINSKQAFLVVLNDNGQPLLVANLHPLNNDETYRLHPGLSRDTLKSYIDSRSLWLAPVEQP